MPAVTLAVSVLSASTTLSPAVGTVSVALVEPLAMDTEAGGVPDSTEPLCVTLTATASGSAASRSSATVYVAAVPSVTAAAPAAIVATGSAARVTVTV